jgi:plasmid stabilization system protein ParE
MVINWADEARQDQAEILAYINDKNPQAANVITYQILETIEQMPAPILFYIALEKSLPPENS